MATIRNLLIRISVSEDTSKGVRKVTAALANTNREIDKADQSSSRLTGTMSKLGRTSLSKLTSGLSAVAKFSAVAGKGLLVVAAGAAALNTAASAGAALAPLAGTLLLLPGAALGAATAMGTLKLATSGLSDAFKTALDPSADPKKLAESMKYLSPAARSLTLELRRLQPAFLDLRNTAQQALLQPLQGQLTAVSRVLLGPLRQGVAQVASQFGQAGRQAAEFARQSATVAVLKQAFGSVALSIHALLPAMQPVLAGLRSLASVGLSFLPGLAAGASRAATAFGQWAQQIVASGKAAEWIRNALATLKQLGGIVSQVGGILKSVFSAASAAGSGFLGVIGQALSKLNAFLKTAAGQAALTSIFQALAAIGQTLGPVIVAIVTQLGALAKPIGDLAQMIGPILTVAINALGPALVAVTPGIAALFGGLSSIVTAIAPALPALGKAISGIGIALGVAFSDPAFQKGIVDLVGAFGTLLIAAAPLLPIIANLAGTLLTALAPVIKPLATAVATFATALGGQLGKVITAIAPTLPPLAVALANLLIALIPLLPPLAAILIAATPLIPIFTALIQFLTPLAPYLTVAAAAWWLLNIAMDANPIGLIIIAITALVLIIVAIATKTTWFQTLWHGAWSGIKAAAQAVGDFFTKILWPGIKKVLGYISGGAVGTYHDITGAFNKVIGFFTGLPGKISKAASGMFNGVRDAFKGAINWIISRWNNFHLSLGGWRVNLPFGMGFTIPSVTLNTPNIPYLAKGGLITGAGAAMVGENGPELVNLPQGAEVVPNHQLRGPAASPAGVNATAPAGVTAMGKSGGLTARLVIDVTGADGAMKTMVKKWVRTDGGGDVQVAFGGSS